MKLFRLPLLFFAITILFIGCKKKDSGPANYFSFKGKTYAIANAIIAKNIVAHPADSTKEFHVFELGFLSITGADSTMLLIAVGDLATNTLGGNYPSLDINSTASRGIIPAAFLSTQIAVVSILEIAGNEIYYTGQGGSIDISLSGANYTISMNSISAGLYTNLGAQYNEIGTIKGKYSGSMETVTFTAMSGNSKFKPNNIIESIKDFVKH